MADTTGRTANILKAIGACVVLGFIIVVAVILNNNLSSGEDTAVEVAATIKTDNGDTKINWERYGSTTVDLSKISDSTYTITDSGTYYLSGSYEGTIIVNADHDSGKVRLVLDNVTIKNSSGPAIACYSTDDLVIELVGENYVEDGKTYSSDYDEDVRGAIYSKDDLSFTGDGTLTLVANYEDGIVGKDDLKFNSGTYKITSADDGIRGTDSVYIVAGNFTINASGDAIKSTNETDTGKGFVLIEDGAFAITAGAKGIKAINSILIYNGTYNINSKDDSVHSNNYVGIVNGEIAIASGDDGVHADKQLIIDGGKINITKSYEGLEAQAITINNGEISVVSSDDGINAGGGSDQSAQQGRPGANTYNTSEACILTINGGSVYVNAAGDGVDSNGYIYFNGGTVVVDGPTYNGDGALDAEYGIIMNGGSVFAIGMSGMAETLGASGSVYNISAYFASTLSAGTKLEIKDSSGNTVLSHTSAKTFNHLAAGTAAFVAGETYTIYVNGSAYESFTISSMTTTVGNSNGNFNNMNMGGGRRR